MTEPVDPTNDQETSEESLADIIAAQRAAFEEVVDTPPLVPTTTQVEAVVGRIKALAENGDILPAASDVAALIPDEDFQTLVAAQYHDPRSADTIEVRVKQMLRGAPRNMTEPQAGRFKLTRVRGAASTLRSRFSPTNVRRLDRPQHNTDERRFNEENAPDISAGYYQPATSVVASFNKRHAVTRLGSTSVVVERDAKGDLTFWKFGGFRDRYANVKVPNANPRMGPAAGADYWLEHTQRKQFLGGTVFAPRQRVAADTLNLWRGFGFKLQGFGGYELPSDMTTMPRPRGSWSRWRKHVLHHLCGADRELFRRIIWRLADSVQYPNRQGQTILTLRGDEGVGKGIYGSVVIKLFGEHGLHITSPRLLTGQFNGLIDGKCAVFADESAFAGSHAVANLLKGLATESTIAIERKGVDVVMRPNTLHIDMATNDDFAVRVGRTSRRSIVLNVADTRRGDREYFKAIMDELERDDNSGYRAMLWDLLTMNLDEFDPRSIPTTQALAEQRALSQEPHESWWREVLMRGYVYESQLGHFKVFARWNPVYEIGEAADDTGSGAFVATELLHASYLRHFSQARGAGSPRGSDWIVAWLAKTFGFGRSQRSSVPFGESRAPMPGAEALVMSGRKRGVDLPSLSEARALFVSTMGLEELEEEIWGGENPTDPCTPCPPHFGAEGVQGGVQGDDEAISTGQTGIPF